MSGSCAAAVLLEVVLASEIIHAPGLQPRSRSSFFKRRPCKIKELWMGQAVLDAVSRFLEPGGFAIIVNAASYHRASAAGACGAGSGLRLHRSMQSRPPRLRR